MSDARQSTPGPPDLPESPVFRETFLAHFPPADASLLRAAGTALANAVLEGTPYATDEPAPTQELRAAGLDLAHLVQYLQDLGTVRHHSAVTDREHDLSRRAELWAATLLQPLVEILSTVGAPEAEPSVDRLIQAAQKVVRDARERRRLRRGSDPQIDALEDALHTRQRPTCCPTDRARREAR